MNRKEILFKARKDVRKNFWIYLCAVLIVGAISVLADNSIFKLFSSFIYFVKSGSSDIRYLLEIINASNIVSMGIFSPIITFFLLNPLSVGVNALFLKGTDDTPKIDCLASPFKYNYRNTILTLLVSNVLMAVILIGISIPYSIVVSVFLVISAMFSNTSLIASICFFSIAAIAVTIVYLAILVCIEYNFAVIPYMLAEKSNMSFSELYNASRKMVYKKKWEIFKIDIRYDIYILLSTMIPIGFIFLGMYQMSSGLGGTLYIVIGIFSSFPIICIGLLIVMYKNAAWARIYNELKTDNNEYDTPTYENPISYTQNNFNSGEDDTNLFNN